MGNGRIMDRIGLMTGALIGADLLDPEMVTTLDGQGAAINAAMQVYADAAQQIQADGTLSYTGKGAALMKAREAAREKLATIERTAYGDPPRSIAKLTEDEGRLSRVLDPAVSLRAADQAKAPNAAELVLRGMREAEVRESLRGRDGAEILALAIEAAGDADANAIEFLAAILLAPRTPVRLLGREDAELVARRFAQKRWPETIAALTQATRLRSYLESNLAQARQVLTAGGGAELATPRDAEEAVGMGADA